MSRHEQTLHWIFGGALVLIGIFVVVALVIINSEGGSSDSEASITNSTPTITLLYVSTANTTEGSDGAVIGMGLTLTASSTKDIYTFGRVSDANGDLDISSVTGTLFKGAVPGGTDDESQCSADDDDCYVNSACSLFGNNGGNSTATFACVFSVQYYADETSSAGGQWGTHVRAVDASAAVATARHRVGFDVNSLLSVRFGSGGNAIFYGTLAAGDSTTRTNADTTSAAYATTTFSNNGNVAADFKITGENMSCSGSGILEETYQYYTTSTPGGTSITSYTNLGATGTASKAVTALAAPSTGTIPVSDTVYWGISLPDNPGGVGTCTGINTLEVVQA